MSNEITLPKANLKHTVVSAIELINGKSTQIITIFNNSEINFEEMLMGINTAIGRQIKFFGNIKTVQHTFCSIKRDGLNEIALMDKVDCEFYTTKFN